MATTYATKINQYKFEYHLLVSASFDKVNEDDQRSDDVELLINLKNNQNLAEPDISNNDAKSQLEHQIQIQEKKESGRRLDKINSMKIRFYKTGELNGSIYVRIPLRSSAVLNIENNGKKLFLMVIIS